MSQVPETPNPVFTRKYQPIWHEIKTLGICRVTAHKVLHARIIKAVKKEKDEDLEFKFELNELGKRAKLEIKQSHSIIEFKLIKSLRVDTL